MAYSLLYSHTSSDLPSVRNEPSQMPPSKYLSSSKTLNLNCKCSSETSLISPSTSVKAEILYSSCPGSFSNNNDSDFSTFDCPVDLCIRCQNEAVTIDNRCVCLCETEDCLHKSLRFKQYYNLDQLCRPSLEFQGYRLLENVYSSVMDNEGTGQGSGELRYIYGDSSSSDDEDTSSSDSSSSSCSSQTTSSSSSSPSESINSPLTIYC